MAGKDLQKGIGGLRVGIMVFMNSSKNSKTHRVMAELDTSGGGHKKGPGVKKGKKLSTRIDLTPMVDLGFLLITFFMYTTTLAKPKTMEINMPYKDPKMKEEDQSKVKES